MFSASSLATSPSSAPTSSSSAASSLYSTLVFLPEFTEHPKPKRRSTIPLKDSVFVPPGSESSDSEVTFLQDFIAGGMAGSASVIVGHPLDTMKVRVQNSHASSTSIRATIQEFGGWLSLFRGMTAPLGTAALVNALVFSSYGVGSTLFDSYICHPANLPIKTPMPANHDPWPKSMMCGSFAGLIQCLVICPMEHVKCRLQMQHHLQAAYKGPLDATRKIVQEHGVHGLYRGWWASFWREVPAFGFYFVIYDYVKDASNTYFAKQAGLDLCAPPSMAHRHTWLASTLAGGLAGSITWGAIYPIDVIKTHIQTSGFATPVSQRTILAVARNIIQTYGWRHLFRGITITLVRAFPVNGTIFPVYEFTLMHIKDRGWAS
jgi:solute carrier family 25 carnitine/acylcarnitine transporter 20/29